MSDEVLIAGFVVVFPLLAWLARYAALDLDHRGVPGWFVGILILVAAPIGIPLWLMARRRNGRWVSVGRP